MIFKLNAEENQARWKVGTVGGGNGLFVGMELWHPGSVSEAT